MLIWRAPTRHLNGANDFSEEDHAQVVDGRCYRPPGGRLRWQRSVNAAFRIGRTRDQRCDTAIFIRRRSHKGPVPPLLASLWMVPRLALVPLATAVRLEKFLIDAFQ
jgi:hypothetical protein